MDKFGSAIIAVILSVCFFSYFDLFHDANRYKSALIECELELPRNQKCEIYARPVEVK